GSSGRGGGDERGESGLEEDADGRVLRGVAEERVVAVDEHMVLGAEAVAGDGALLALVDGTLPRPPAAGGREEGALAAGIGPVRRAELVLEPQCRVGVPRVGGAVLASD